MEQNLIIQNLDTEIESIKSNIVPVLNSCRERVNRAIAAGNSIIDLITDAGGEITPEIDKQCNTYLIKVDATSKELLEARKPITQAFDLLRKQFTDAENAIDAKKNGTISYKIQELRNSYAKQCAEQEKLRKAEIERQARKKEESINIRKEIAEQFNRYFNNHLTEKKLAFQNFFNQINLETFDKSTNYLSIVKFIYDSKHWQNFKEKVSCKLHTQDEYSQIFVEVMNESYNNVCPIYISEMEKCREEIKMQFQSKKNELLKIREFELEQQALEKERLRIENEKKTGSAARQKELEAQRLENERLEKIAKDAQEEALNAQRKREQLENERIAVEKIAAEKQASLEIETSHQQAIVLNMFDSEIEKASNLSEIPLTKEGYEIKVHDISAYMEMFLIWYKDEGVGLTVDKMDKKLDFVRKYAEKIASKDESKIIKSKSFSYEPIYKAINK